MPRKKSKKLKHLEEKLKLVKKELARRKKSSVSTPSKSKRGRKSTKSIFEECSALLEKVKKMQYSKAFLIPVDWKGLNIPTYPQIIKRPMDLSTVERKLNNNSYHTPYDFARDMRLIYQNATTFNKPTTPYYVAATKFAKKFEEEFERKVVDIHETNDFTRKMCKVIVTLIKRDDSIPFRAPVNPKVLEIPDYLDVIDTPMDLGTILNKINYYTQFKQFAADLFLVWNNCCRYNPKQNQIHQTAIKLKEYSQKQLNRYCQSEFQLWEDDELDGQIYPQSNLVMNNNNSHKSMATKPMAIEPQPQPKIQPIAQPQSQPESQPESESQSQPQMEEDLEESEDKTDIFKMCDDMDDEEEAQVIMINYLFKKEELDPNVINNLDFQQKEELQRGIQCLDSDHFDPLINMLQTLIPEGEGEDDEVELDVDSIDDDLQVKMYNYMLRAITQQENERKKREGGNNIAIHAHVGNAIMPMSMPMPKVQQHNDNQNESQSQSVMDDDIKMIDNSGNENSNNVVSGVVSNNVMENDENIMVDNNDEQLPNVLNAFPTQDDVGDAGDGDDNGGQDDGMRVDGNGNDNENKDDDDDDDDVDEDIDMDDNSGGNVGIGGGDGDIGTVAVEGDDIIADIENVVADENNNVNVMVIDNMNMNMDENNNDNDNVNEQKQQEPEINNDNDITDNENNDDGLGQVQGQLDVQIMNVEKEQELIQIQGKDDGNIDENNDENEIENKNENVNNINIPTMPVLQIDDSTKSDKGIMNVEMNNDGKDDENNNQNSNENNNNALNEEEIINGGLNDNNNTNDDSDLNVNDSLDKTSEHIEDDDVETPLADEIEF